MYQDYDKMQAIYSTFSKIATERWGAGETTEESNVIGSCEPPPYRLLLGGWVNKKTGVV